VSILRIVRYGDPVLGRPALPVTNVNGELARLVSNMLETMYAAPGVGLSANQVAVGKRLAVIDTSVGEDPKKLVVIINPEIKEAEGEQVGEEGCLSVPDFSADVLRPKKVFVTGLDLDGNPVQYEATDLLARAFCHEVDHLNGTYFIDRISAIKRELIKRQIRKRVRAGEW